VGVAQAFLHSIPPFPILLLSVVLLCSIQAAAAGLLLPLLLLLALLPESVSRLSPELLPLLQQP
jgi:hypothetical protein